MSVPQYLRQISLKLGGATTLLDLSELRIRFEVRRSDTRTPNTAYIRVYNLGENTLHKVPKEFERVVLKAGYAGNYGIIFDGALKQIKYGRENQTDSYIDILAADGDQAYNWSVIMESLAAGSTAGDHYHATLKAMALRGITPGATAFLSGSKLPRGKVMFGMTRDYLDLLGRTQDVSWSIQNGKLTIIPNTAYLPDEAIVVQADTGMIGMPVRTEKGVDVKTLLNPSILIGRRLKIARQSIPAAALVPMSTTDTFRPEPGYGTYKVLVVKHSGDTQGGSWYTESTCIAVDGTLVPKDIDATPGAISTPGWVKPFGSE